MKILMTLALVLMVIGCVSNPVELPDWTIAERTPTEVVGPSELPLLCEIPWTHDECWAAVEKYEVVAEANKEIANDIGRALQATESAYDAILQAGKHQQEYCEIKQQQLDREVSEHKSDNWLCKGIIGAMVIGVVATK